MGRWIGFGINFDGASYSWRNGTLDSRKTTGYSDEECSRKPFDMNL
jgi:hypothetical protein